MTKVFVYGTLKEGHGNHDYLRTSKLIRRAYVPGFLLINTTGYPYAFEAEPTDFVIGEVYEVDDKTLENLDSLEGYPSHYNRAKVNAYELDTLLSGERKQADEAWIYYIEDDKYQMAQRYGTTHEWGFKPTRNYYTLNKTLNEEIAELFESKGEQPFVL